MYCTAQIFRNPFEEKNHSQLAHDNSSSITFKLCCTLSSSRWKIALSFIYDDFIQPVNDSFLGYYEHVIIYNI